MLLRGHCVWPTRPRPPRSRDFDVWSTLADVQRRGHQKDHVLLVPRHSQVPRGEALVIDVGGANVRALEEDAPYGQGVARLLEKGVVQVAVGEIVGPGLRLYLCR